MTEPDDKPDDNVVYQVYLDAYTKAAMKDALLGLEDKAIECYAARALGIFDGRGEKIEEPRSLVELFDAIDRMCEAYQDEGGDQD